jgi:hypothetical protein
LDFGFLATDPELALAGFGLLYDELLVALLLLPVA